MIRINKVDTQLSITSSRPRQSISQPPADFELTQKPAEVEIHSEQVKVRIDQSQCFNEAGRKDLETLGNELTERAKQMAAEAVARIVDEGSTMAEIRSNVDAIAEIAYNNIQVQQDFNFDMIPKSRPKIDFVGGTVDIQVGDGYVSVNSKPNRPQIDTEPGKVEINVIQKPHISFDYIGGNIDKTA